MTSTSTAKIPGTLATGLEPAVLELLASRICHDLISPVGAVHNGVEFLQEMGIEAGTEAVDLIAHSASNAAAKLQIFRLVYGAGGRDANIKPDDVKKAFAALVDADGKIKQDWDSYGLPTDKLPLGFCKILMGTLMLAQECLPKGGTIRVTADGTRVAVSASGTDAAIRGKVREALARGLTPEELDPRLVHPFVLAVLAAEYGFAVSVADEKPGQVVFNVTPA